MESDIITVNLSLIYLCILILYRPVAGLNWIYMGLLGANNVPTMERTVCNELPYLVSRQIEVCETHPDTITPVSEGARRGILECQSQFKNDRWNCTTDRTENDIFGHILKRGSKETAFVYAVTSAGVVHSVTQACSSGNLTECTCDMSNQGKTTAEGWKWGGCSDNVMYGIQFSKDFVDAPESSKHTKSQNIRNLMNLHNNDVGRQAIRQLMKRQCRCHGVSGSCELKTCWYTLPKFNDVGDYLKKKYETAVRIKPSARKRLRRQDRTGKSVLVSKAELVHIHKSPNYCIEDKSKGILGTKGRPCNKTSTGPDGCDLLCCGRGYNTRVEELRERCQCKFYWCCYVKCKVCEELIDVHTCK